LATGWELEHERRDDEQRVLLDGLPQSTDFGENLTATVQRIALFAQDEWDYSPTLSFYLGARWEGIRTVGDSAAGSRSNASSVLTPLAHLVWKNPDRKGEQVRASLTRSYRSPETSQLVGLTRISSLYPDLTVSNLAVAPDRTGNPDLQPELSWGLELGWERYLEAGGLLAANVYVKRIDHVIRNVVRLQPATATTAARWVSRPENVGNADAAGLELEAKARASEIFSTDLPIDLRSNLSLMWSRVSGISGPDNRIEGQPPWTFNLGADWVIRGTPLTVGASWNFTPAFRVQEIDQQVVRESRKSALDAYAVWRVHTDVSLRLSLNNILGEDWTSGNDFLNPDGTLRQSNDTVTRSDTVVGLRAEIKF
jgi:iron complex outermembrane receptor protein